MSSKLTDLTEKSSLDSSDEFYSNAGGLDRKITAETLSNDSLRLAGLGGSVCFGETAGTNPISSVPTSGKINTGEVIFAVISSVFSVWQFQSGVSGTLAGSIVRANEFTSGTYQYYWSKIL
jgi:hypothetical protein